MKESKIVKVKFTNFKQEETGLLVSKITNNSEDKDFVDIVDHVVLYAANGHGSHGLVYCEVCTDGSYKATAHGNRAVMAKLKVLEDTKPNNIVAKYLDNKRKNRSYRKNKTANKKMPKTKVTKSNNGWTERH